MKKMVSIVLAMAAGAWLGVRYLRHPTPLEAAILGAMVGGIIAMGLFVPTDTKKPK